MASIDVNALAGAVGISVESFRAGLGVLLNFLKQRLPAGLFDQVQTHVPEAQAMMDAGAQSGGGGLLGGLTGAVGGTAGLLAKLSALGLSLDQIKAFLPQALEFFKVHVPPEVQEQVKAEVQKPA